MSVLEGLVIVVGTMGFLWHAVYFVLRLIDLPSPTSDETADRPITALRKELWWVEVHLAIPAQILHLAWTFDSGWDGLSIAVLCFLEFVFWFDDHDDRWKRRRKKAAAKIKAAITVKLPVPALPAPA